MEFAITTSDHIRGRRGRPRINLFSTIVNDLKEHKLNLKFVDDLYYNLRNLANNISLWNDMFKINNVYFSLEMILISFFPIINGFCS